MGRFEPPDAVSAFMTADGCDTYARGRKTEKVKKRYVGVRESLDLRVPSPLLTYTIQYSMLRSLTCDRPFGSVLPVP